MFTLSVSDLKKDKKVDTNYALNLVANSVIAKCILS